MGDCSSPRCDRCTSFLVVEILSFARARLRLRGLGLRGSGEAPRGAGSRWGAGRRNEVESGERNMSVAVLGCHRQRGRARSRGANFRRG